MLRQRIHSERLPVGTDARRRQLSHHRDSARRDERAWHQLIDRYQGRLLAFWRARLVPAGRGRGRSCRKRCWEFLTSLNRYDTSRSLETHLFAILRYKISELLESDSGGRSSSAASISMTIARFRRTVCDRNAQPGGLALRTGPPPGGGSGDDPARLIRNRDKGKLEDLQVVESSAVYVGMRNKGGGGITWPR